MVTLSFQLEQSKDRVAFAWAERTMEEEQDGAAWAQLGECWVEMPVRHKSEKTGEWCTPREDARRQDGTSLANQ